MTLFGTFSFICINFCIIFSTFSLLFSTFPSFPTINSFFSAEKTPPSSDRSLPHQFSPLSVLSLASFSPFSSTRRRPPTSSPNGDASTCVVCREPIRSVRSIHRCDICHELSHSACAALAAPSCKGAAPPLVSSGKGQSPRKSLFWRGSASGNTPEKGHVAAAAAAADDEKEAMAALYGVSLVEICGRERATVPVIVSTCTAAILDRGLGEVGIFRLAGGASAIESLKGAFARGHVDVDDDVWSDIHVFASLLKWFLRQLPEPLIPFEVYSDIMEAVGTEFDSGLATWLGPCGWIT